MERSRMKSRKALLILALALILAVIVFANRGKIQFNWVSFGQQLHHISWPRIAAGVALIYSTYWLRSARWSVFISSTKKISPFSLVGPQFIGFTAVALLGRLADITRPALVAESVAAKIRGFRDGLNAISSARDFLLVALLSLAMWALIGMAYVQTVHAFVDSPQLATLRFSQVMLLMGASIAASIFQIPIVGWFTQIGATAFAMVAFYGASKEAATACGALLLFVTFLSIIPAGLLFARLNHVSLRPANADVD